MLVACNCNTMTFFTDKFPVKKTVASSELVEYLHKSVEGFLEVLYLEDNKVMAINAKARSLGLKMNNLASEIAGTNVYGISVLLYREDLESAY